MDLNLAFFAFCITVIALVSIVHNKDKLAERAVDTLGKLAGSALRFSGKLKNGKDKDADPGKTSQD